MQEIMQWFHLYKTGDEKLRGLPAIPAGLSAEHERQYGLMHIPAF